MWLIGVEIDIAYFYRVDHAWPTGWTGDGLHVYGSIMLYLAYVILHFKKEIAAKL